MERARYLLLWMGREVWASDGAAVEPAPRYAARRDEPWCWSYRADELLRQLDGERR